MVEVQTIWDALDTRVKVDFVMIQAVFIRTARTLGSIHMLKSHLSVAKSLNQYKIYDQNLPSNIAAKRRTRLSP